MTDELTPEQEYDAEWDEAQKGTGKEIATKDDEAGLTPAEPDKEKAIVTEKVPSDELADKRIKDLQTGFTRVSQRNAELESKLETYKKETPGAPDLAARDNETLETLYNEYPEIKPAFNPLLADVDEIKATLEELKISRKQDEEDKAMRVREQIVTNFETNIKPKVMNDKDGHPDFEEIIATDDYWEWANGQRESIKVAALQSDHPDDIKMALSAYKKDRAMPEVRQKKEEEDASKNKKINNSKSLRGGSTPFELNKGTPDPNDYDAGWDEAEGLYAKR